MLHPLRQVQAGENTYFLWDAAAVEWAHVLAVSDWQVLPALAVSPLEARLQSPTLQRGVAMRVTGPPEGLLQWFFRSRTNLSLNELLQLAERLGLERCSSRWPRQTVLSAVATHVAMAMPEDERAAYVEKVLRTDVESKPEEASAALDDPLL